MANDSEIIELDCDARRQWNPSGFEVQQGCRYKIVAQGTWVDLYIKTGPEGFIGKRLQRFSAKKRAPHANWFALMGCIGKNAPYFVVGKTLKFTAESSGELYFFANDIDSMRWNNWGKIHLTIEKIEYDYRI